MEIFCKNYLSNLWIKIRTWKQSKGIIIKVPLFRIFSWIKKVGGNSRDDSKRKER